MAIASIDSISIPHPGHGLAVSRLASRVVCALTLVLIFMGALVKSHEAGLSVPDWPTTYGYNMFAFPPSEWRANVFYEHTHRLVASVVGIATLFLSCWVAFNDSRNSIRWSAAAALAIVVAQGVLGGLTVLFLLPAYLSVAHGVLAQTFLLLAVFLARAFPASCAHRLQSDFEPAGLHTARWAFGLTAVVWIQLVIGAIVRHTESGLAIPDFPTMGGQWLPLFNEAMLSRINEWRLEQTFTANTFLPDATVAQVAVHATHRLWAIVVVAVYLVYLRDAWVRRSAHPRAAVAAAAVGLLVIAQITLGVLTILTARGPLVTSLHVAVGAALLAASWFCALDTAPKLATRRPISSVEPAVVTAR
ncbi:MAG: COX15/CtaA family protein [Candidatus Hydrogenedentes bacterium]|nr:COX15/CtaA family protein [Candidatus Hydrogenedentota bacterium]